VTFGAAGVGATGVGAAGAGLSRAGFCGCGVALGVAGPTGAPGAGLLKAGLFGCGVALGAVETGVAGVGSTGAGLPPTEGAPMGARPGMGFGAGGVALTGTTTGFALGAAAACCP